MNSKILLLALSVAALSSCSTTYKSGQTPDDVYYSPVRMVDETRKEDNKKEEVQPTDNSTANDTRIRMRIRDRRWRDFDDDYNYSYNNSPYNYCHCACNNTGYYYNPYYNAWPVYSPRATYTAPINSTPRMVNLNTYKNYATTTTVTDPKTGATTTTTTPARRYSNSNTNSNNGGSRVGNIIRQVFTPSSSTNNTNNNNTSTNNNTNNNNRTYSPAPSSSSNSSSSSSGSSSGSGTSVSRPGRGG
jgi:hypothetical protein